MSEPAPLFVPTCAAENMQQDGTCTTLVWMPYPQQVLPPLTLADGTLVSFAIVGVWVVGLKARAAFRAARMGVF